MDKLNELLNFGGGIDFPNVTFRPGAPFTTPFGLDNTFSALRIHNAIDRGCSDHAIPENNKIFCPFPARLEWLPTYGGGFGSMLRILVDEWRFEIRIMHMNDINSNLKGFKGYVIPGTVLGYAGVAGIGTGRHTHVEVVSYDEVNETLDALLAAKNINTTPITPEQVRTFGFVNGIPNAQEQFAAEVKKRSISIITNHTCKRLDYHDSKLKTFYSSRSLFGM